MRTKIFIFITAYIFIARLCQAATFYVDGSRVDDLGSGSSWTQAKKYIYSGIQLLSSGDTLIVKDGTYVNDLDRIRGIPSGTLNNYTTIKAENDFGVVLSGLSVGTALATEQAVINLYQKSWVSVEGFVIKDCQGSGIYTLSAVQMTNSDHCRLRKIGIKNGTHPVAEYSGGISTSGSSYCLFEDIFICGMMRYGINVGGGSASHHNILRRVVVRWDYCTTAQPRAAITVYGANMGQTPNSDILLQNCIVLDGNLGSGSTFTGGFSVPHETSFIQRYGCISLNNRGYGFHSSEDSLSHDNTNTHCVNWDSDSGMWWRRLASGMSGAYNNTSNRNIDGGNNGASFCEAVNNIMVGGAAISNMSSTTGNVNRNASAFTYIIRSPVAGAGATIEKQMGVTGTIYGETGYDTLTGTNLWPFPNEDQIGNLFRESNDPPSGLSPSTNNTTRGFCADGQTLTKYIWEYLGNAIPAEIYGGGANTPPVLSAIGAKSIAEGAVLTFTLSASDADGDSLTYSASNLPTGASFNTSTRVFSWTPGYDQAATYSAVRFSVSDGSLTDSEDITITVTNTNRQPVLSAIGNKSVAENSALTFTISATDLDSDSLTYSASGLPTGAAFNTSTRVFSWTPSYTQSGSHNLTFSVNDGNSGTASETITITVSNLNRDPVLGAIGGKSVVENSNLAFTLSATDPDGDSLTYSASNLPAGASFNTSSAVFSWTPGLSQSGSYPGVRFTVTDGSLTDSEDITITVTNTNTPPVLSAIGAKSIAEGAVLTFTLSASDADGDSLTYSASNLPTGASFNASTRVFSWTPGYDQAATYSAVRFSVTDASLTDSEDIAITVTNTEEDIAPPYVEGVNPASDEVQVPLDANIAFHIKDKTKGVDIATLSLSVKREGDSAPTDIILNGENQLSVYPNSVTIQGIPSDYVVSYDPPKISDYQFKYEQVVNVNISASDLAGNSMGAYSYSFTTAMMLRGKNLKIGRKK